MPTGRNRQRETRFPEGRDLSSPLGLRVWGTQDGELRSSVCLRGDAFWLLLGSESAEGGVGSPLGFRRGRAGSLGGALKGRPELFLGLRGSGGSTNCHRRGPAESHLGFREGGLGACWNSGKGDRGLFGHLKKGDQRSALRLRDKWRSEKGAEGSPQGSGGGPGVPSGAQMKGLWSALRLRKWGQSPPRDQRTTGTQKRLCVPWRSLGSPSPGLPGPARPGRLQAQRQPRRLPQASHPGLLGRDPSRSPASAPRRPQLRDASNPSASARRGHRARPPGRPLRSLRPRPHRPPLTLQGYFGLDP